MIIDKIKNREYELIDGIPRFITQEEYESNIEFGKYISEGGWIAKNWQWNITNKSYFDLIVERVLEHSGLILEVGAGPGGGTMPAILMKDIDAQIIISDICPMIPREWKNFFETNSINPPNVEYVAVNTCDLPFKDETIDIITDNGGFGNIEGDKMRAIESTYRVLKKGGIYILEIGYVTDEYIATLPQNAIDELMNEFPCIFYNFYNDFVNIGYTSIETLRTGTWNNKNDESGLATLCRELGVVMEFTTATICCTK